MDSEFAAKLKADILSSVGDMLDERLGAVQAEPSIADPESSSITVFEWSKFSGDRKGFYCGSKVGYASANRSLEKTGPHESMVCYDAVTEELFLFGEVPKRVNISTGAPCGIILLPKGEQPKFRRDDPLAQTQYSVASLSRVAFRQLLVFVRDHHQSHWQAVVDGFDHLPPPDVAA